MSKIVIFCDGASKGNPGPGGWGAIVANEHTLTELGGREDMTTNNRMELQALYKALVHAAPLRPTIIDVYADSSYVIQGATAWGRGWRRNGWITSTKQPVLNKDLWEPLLNIIDTLNAKMQWHNVGGHVGIPANERADEIASGFALNDEPNLYTGSRRAYGIDITNLEVDESLQQKKSDSKSRSRAKAHSYISEVGGVVEVHATWAECEERVRGKKARFKKAVTPQEEVDIIKQFSS